MCLLIHLVLGCVATLWQQHKHQGYIKLFCSAYVCGDRLIASPLQKWRSKSSEDSEGCPSRGKKEGCPSIKKEKKKRANMHLSLGSPLKEFVSRKINWSIVDESGNSEGTLKKELHTQSSHPIECICQRTIACILGDPHSVCVCVCVFVPALQHYNNFFQDLHKPCWSVEERRFWGGGGRGGGLLFLLQGWLHATPFCLIMHVDYGTGCFLQQVIDSVGLESQQWCMTSSQGTV